MLKPLCALAFAVLPAPSVSAEPARVQAAATLAGDLGPGLKALERRGLLLTSGDSKPVRILDVAWEPLERAAAASKRLVDFLAAYEAARKGSAPPDRDDDFADLRAMPLGGLLTGDVRALVAAVGDRDATTRERVAKAEKGSDARKDLADVREAAPRLAAAPDLPARLKDILSAPDEPSAVKLTAPELHARSEDGTPLEPGDKAVFSIAYWVDGLAKGAQTDVVEALYLDQGALGLALVRRESRRRASGGPYVVNVTAVVPAAGRLTYRLALDSAEAAPLSREASVPVSDALDALRAEAGRAESLARACRLDESTAVWHEVLSGLGTQDSPARAALTKEAKSRLRAAEDWARDRRELAESLDGARLYATAEQCEYRTDRAERALKLLSGLPAGCDRGEAGGPGVAAELADLSRLTDSRRRLQEGFRASVKKARDAESSCRAQDAARLYASALALLDSDAGARCGALDAEYQAVRLGDLPRVAGAEGLSAALEAELAKARKRFSAGDPAGALKVLLPLSTALRRAPDARCHAALLKDADELAQGAGMAVAPVEASALRLGPDPASEAVAAAKKDWERRQAEADEARGQAENLQAPRSAGEAE